MSNFIINKYTVVANEFNKISLNNEIINTLSKSYDYYSDESNTFTKIIPESFNNNPDVNTLKISYDNFINMRNNLIIESENELKESKLELDTSTDLTDVTNLTDLTDLTDLTNEVKESNLEPSILNENDLFDLISVMQWVDLDERKMSISDVKKIQKTKLKLVFNTMKHFSIKLKNAILTVSNSLESMDEENMYNILFHIIAKGKTFYHQIIANPDFCLYIFDHYQPLYTYMLQLIK
jgi:hypothetical protein